MKNQNATVAWESIERVSAHAGTARDAMIFALVVAKPGISRTEIAQVMGMNDTYLSHRINKMIAWGLLEKKFSATGSLRTASYYPILTPANHTSK